MKIYFLKHFYIAGFYVFMKLYTNEKNGYFAINKEKNAFTGNSVGGIPLKNGPVVFIIKTE